MIDRQGASGREARNFVRNRLSPSGSGLTRECTAELAVWRVAAEKGLDERQRDSVGLKRELLLGVVARLYAESKAACRKGRGATVRDRDIARERAEAGGVICIVLCVDVLQSPLATGGKVVGDDGRVDEIECECDRFACGRRGCRSLFGACGDQLLENVFQVAAVWPELDMDDWSNDFDRAQVAGVQHKTEWRATDADRFGGQERVATAVLHFDCRERRIAKPIERSITDRDIYRISRQRRGEQPVAQRRFRYDDRQHADCEQQEYEAR